MISRKALFFYALPGIPLAALTLPLYILLPTFYAQAIGLPLAAIGSALFAVRLVDAVGDPLIGWMSDKWRGPFGRRKSWFLASIPLTVLSTFMLFWPPEEASLSYLTIWGVLLSIGYTMSILPYTAWGAELSTDYDARARISGWREGFILIGTLLAIALPFSLFSLDDPAAFHGLAALAILVAVGLPIAGILMVWRLPEPADRSSKTLSLVEGLGQMRRNKPFLRLLFAYLINGLANGLPATLFLLFVDARLQMPDSQGAYLFLYFLCGIAGVPVFLALASRTAKHRAWCIAMLIACCVFATAPFIGPGSAWAFGILCVVTGFCVGADLSLPSAIQADVIDVDTARSGDQRSGAYFAAWSLATKLALAIAAGIAFPVLGYFDFNAVNPAQSPQLALTALAILYAIVPIGLKLIAVAMIWNFPITRESQRELNSRIAATRA